MCFLDLTERTATFRTFRDVLIFDRFLHGADAPERAILCVENSNLQNVNFDMTGDRPELAKKGRNVGTNQAVSELAVRSAVDRYGAFCVMNISPREKGKKYAEPVFFAALRADRMKTYGYTGSQDQRDAYQLARMAASNARLRRARVAQGVQVR